MSSEHVQVTTTFKLFFKDRLHFSLHFYIKAVIIGFAVVSTDSLEKHLALWLLNTPLCPLPFEKKNKLDEKVRVN